MAEGDGQQLARRVQVAAGSDGSLVYVADFQPEATPAVQAADLMRAWGAARGAANGARWGIDRALLFRKPDGALAKLSLADAEARCWAGAVDRLFGLDHVYGLAVCLRLLALVDLLARAPWLAGMYDLAGGEAELHPALLSAAATCPLDRDARLVDGEVRGRLRVVASTSTSGA